MKQTGFETTVNTLVKAYINNELKHLDCSRCAVGNILGTGTWGMFFLTPRFQGRFRDQMIAPEGYCIYKDKSLGRHVFILEREYRESEVNKARVAIFNSGYTMNQLARIENAFETAPQGKSDDEWMFNGLMAVVDVLADIHGVDLSIREKSKKLFTVPQ